jgi:hypothetical protein
MKSKYKNYFKLVFSNFSNFLKIISREIRENNYFEFLEKFSRRTQSSWQLADSGKRLAVSSKWLAISG